VKFLTSMGLRGVPEDVYVKLGWGEWLQHKLWFPRPARALPQPKITTAYSRAQFGTGEVERITAVFNERARDDPERGVKRLGRKSLEGVISELPGYEEAKPQHLKSVLAEVGFEGLSEIGLDEFLEICAGLKELFSAPEVRLAKSLHGRIPVEQSGGGV